MNRNPLVSVAVAAACAVVGLFLFNCDKTPSVLGGTGGSSVVASGGSSQTPGDTGGASGGGSGGSDSEPVTYKADANPAWWGIQDAWGPDTPAAPSVDSNCGITEQESIRQPVYVMLLLDRSASMEYSIEDDCYCSNDVTMPGQLCSDTANCTTRWQALAPAVKTTLESSQYVHWGLKFFPSPQARQCTVDQGVDVPVQPDPARQVETQTAIQSEIDSTDFALGTPTTAGIEIATSYLDGLAGDNKKFILLATDGEPNCKNGTVNNVDVDGSSAACGAALAADIPVFVIGIGPSVTNLTVLAQAGGTKDYYPANSPEQLADALSSISKFVGSCTYDTTSEPEDPDNVAVYVNKQLVPKDAADGWKYGASTSQIELTGSYCQDILDGKDTKVQILFGCPGAPPFEPVLP